MLFYKSSQTSKNGNSYTIWKMTDLQGDIKQISVMLFGRAHTVHYKMPLNKVIGLLNPKVSLNIINFLSLFLGSRVPFLNPGSGKS